MVVALKSVAGERGYQVGRDRREQIIEQATKLFGQVGFHHATISEIAAHCGISRAGLLHHFPSKEALLEAVLAARDTEDIARFLTVSSDGDRGLGTLRAVVDLVKANSRRPGIIELYAMLSVEATNPAHPAHDFFRARYEWVRTNGAKGFEQARAAGYLAADVDIAETSAELLALMDGLQVQWLYAPTKIDMPKIIAHRIQQLLTVPL